METDLQTLMEYERGELDTRGTLIMFADLIADGGIHTLPYQLEQRAHNFVASGYITPQGEITPKGWRLIDDMEAEWKALAWRRACRESRLPRVIMRSASGRAARARRKAE
jgi:hypothetical protein